MPGLCRRTGQLREELGRAARAGWSRVKQGWAGLDRLGSSGQRRKHSRAGFWTLEGGDEERECLLLPEDPRNCNPKTHPPGYQEAVCLVSIVPSPS